MHARTNKIAIASYGEPDADGGNARINHLSPVVHFIQHLGFTALAPAFVFDKSGHGEYLFHTRFALLEKTALDAVKQQFVFPPDIMVEDTGIYDNGNALKIGFSANTQHPMHRTPSADHETYTELLEHMALQARIDALWAENRADTGQVPPVNGLFSGSELIP